jgi:hypothetical protein
MLAISWQKFKSQNEYWPLYKPKHGSKAYRVNIMTSANIVEKGSGVNSDPIKWMG